jgi:hypothetical protein
LTERLQHREVSFLAAVALNALSVSDTQARHVSRCLALEFIEQSRFPDARLSGDKDDLALAFQDLSE